MFLVSYVPFNRYVDYFCNPLIFHIVLSLIDMLSLFRSKHALEDGENPYVEDDEHLDALVSEGMEDASHVAITIEAVDGGHAATGKEDGDYVLVSIIVLCHRHRRAQGI
jgi:hypothetical protein